MKNRYSSCLQTKRLLLISFVLLFSFHAGAQTIVTIAGNGTAGFSGDGGPATAAQIQSAYGVAADNFGNVYVSDWNYHRIRKVDPSGIITTIAGTGTPGVAGDGGPATAAQVGWIYGLAADGLGNLYLADWNYYRIRKINSSGIISTVAGNGTFGWSGDGGPATAALIGNAYGVACDAANNVYLSDYSHAIIRKINTAGIISTIAGTGTAGFTGDGGPATAAQIENSYGIASDPAGNVYLSDWSGAGQYRIRKVNTAGIISTFAGTGTFGFSGDGGPATAATLGWVYGIAADGANVYIGDWGNVRVRRVDPAGIITTMAGTGSAGFSGDGGPATAATFNNIYGLAVDGSANVYIGDYYNYRIRKIIGRNRPPTFAGGHSLNLVVCQNSVGDSTNSLLAVHDSDNWQIATWTLLSGPAHGTAATGITAPTNGLVVTAHGLYYTPTTGYSGLDSFKMRISDGYAADTTMVYVTVNPLPAAITGALSVSTGSFTLLADGTPGGTWSSGSSTIATIGGSSGLVIGSSAGTATITYTLPTGCLMTTTVNVFAYAGLSISTIAGTGVFGFTGDGGPATTAQLRGPSGVYTDGAGNVYFADNSNNRIRKVNTSGIISTIAGNGSAGYGGDGTPATGAQLNQPNDITGDAAGNLYFTDYANNAVRKINTSGIISTIAGTGTGGALGDGGAATAAQLNLPAGIAMDGGGNIYIADGGNSKVRKINTSGIITTIAGTGVAGSGGDGGAATAATLNVPMGVYADGNGNIYIADGAANKVRRISSGGTISTFAGTGTAGYTGDGTAATSATLRYPVGIVADPLGNVYVGDRQNNCVRKINSSGVISTIAGNGTAGYGGDHCAAAGGLLNVVLGIWQDGAANIYIADYNNTRVRKISANHAPFFTGGHTINISMCQNSTDTLNSVLPVTDIDYQQGESWAQYIAPVHGTLVCTYSATSTGGTLTPAGIYYTPTIGFTGTDSFMIKVTDCSGGADTTKVIVIVNPPPSAILGAANVCPGQTTALTDPVGVGTWSSSSTSIATVTIGPAGGGVVTGVTAGTATITYTPGAGCSVTREVTVNVAPGPVTGPHGVCLGSAITLGDTSLGGTWSSSSTAIATVTPAGLVTSFHLGTTLITYMRGGCPANYTVTVNPLPGAISAVADMCVGDAITFIEVTGGGTWSSSDPSVATAGSGSGLISAAGAGTTDIWYTLPTGCAVRSPLSVSPLPTSILGTPLVCAGSTVTLSDATAGGSWSASGVGAAATVDVDGNVTGFSAGSMTISYTTGTGCSATVEVTVKAAPAALVGTPSLCVGGYTYMGDPTSGGVWSSGSTPVATVDGMGSVLGVSSGTAVISYTISDGCAATVPVTVNVTPDAISGSAGICRGLTSALSSLPGGGAWSSNNLPVATVTGTGVVTGVALGTATITYMLGSCYVTKTVTVNTAPGAISGITHVCVGATTGLSDAVGGGTWVSSSPSTATIGTTSGIVGGILSGTVTVTYSLGVGCSVSAPVTINPLPSAITGTAGVCIGAATTLLNAPGGTWSNTTTSIATVVSGTGVVSGVAYGTSNITYTSTLGCITTRIVTVNALPSVITGTLNVCPGATTSLLSAPGGGTWSSVSTGIATVISGSGVVSGVAAGTSVISYMLGGTGCVRSTTVTVNALPTVYTVSGGGSYCAGGTGVAITLGGSSGGVSYQLYSGLSPVGLPMAGTGTGINFGLQTSAGSYTVIATSTATGCSRAMSGSVSVGINPLPSVIGGPSAVCVGATMAETDSIAGGTWSSGSTSIATVTAGPAGGGIVSGALTGTTVITYTLPTGCLITRTVTVSLSPGAISGSSNVCSGAATVLSDIAGGGTWSSSNTSAATIGSTDGTVTGGVAGTTIITYSLGTGCTVTRGLTVNAAPAAIGGGTGVCIGSSVSLTEATGGGTWSSSATGTATVTGSGAVWGVSSGTATISYMISTTACYATKTVTVNTAPSAISGPSGVCMGQPQTYSDLVGGGTWSSSSISVATVIPGTGEVTGAGPGSTVITYSLGAGCIAAKTVTVSPVSGIVGARGMCVGTTTTLSDAVSGGAWVSVTTSVATVTGSGVVSGVAIGTSQISYTTLAGCTVTMVMTVNTAPTGILGNRHVCVGAGTLLSDAVGGGTWTSGTPSSATVTAFGGLVTGAVPGTSTITYSLGSGCVATAVVTVDASPAPISGSATNICAGATTLFTDATGGGTWSSSDMSVATTATGSGIVTGISGGTATITYMPGTGCYAIKAITVNPTPAAVMGITDICAGFATTLSDATPGGSWSSRNPAIATVDGSGVVTGVLAGSSVMIDYGFSSGCISSALVTVHTAPLPITGTMNMCIGAMTALSDATGGGTWSVSSGSVATISAGGEVTGAGIGTETVSYTASGCPAIAVVTVNSLPAGITGPDKVCIGSAVILDDATGGGSWSSTGSGGSVHVDAGSGAVAGISAGTALITYSLGAGCSVTATVTVNALPAPVTGGLGTVCLGYTTVVSDATPGGVWSSGDAAIATVSTTGIILGTGGGTAMISYTIDATGCSATAPVIVTAVPGITGVVNLCAYGDTAALSDAMAGGIWSSALVTVTGGGVVTAHAAGVGTVTYTLPSGCYTSTLLTVNPIPAIITGAPQVCTGTTAALSDASGGGVWSVSPAGIVSVTATGGVTGLAVGTATVSYSFPATGCKETFTVTVNPVPSAVIGTLAICANGETTLSDATAGGTWSSGNLPVALVDAGGLVGGVSAGTAVITYAMGGGACTALATMTVNALPADYAVTGGGGYCAGTSGVLVGLSGSQGGVTYHLFHGSTPAGTVAGTGIAVDFGMETAAGVYKVIAGNTSTGCSSQMADSVEITVTPSVIPSVNVVAGTGNTVCAGTVVLFSATPVNGGGGPVYVWSVNGTSAGGSGSTYSYTPVNSDVIKAVLTSDAACALPDTASGAVTMTVITPVTPVVTISASPGLTVKPDQSVTLSASVAGGGSSYSYQWTLNRAAIGGATLSSYTNTFSNNDTVGCIVSGGGNCNPAGSGYVVLSVGNGTGVGVGTIGREGSVKIIPNPSNGIFTIRGALGSTADEAVGIELTDMLGRVVYRGSTVAHGGTIDEQVQLKNTLANGMYLLNLRSESGNKVFHIVIEQ